ncbi:MAG: alkaline phosphatase family protein [Deltaproteobacteria bacterium]|nr:alkaline phosphatase family protein [Deltaproteobacteria bacterium]
MEIRRSIGQTRTFAGTSLTGAAREIGAVPTSLTMAPSRNLLGGLHFPRTTGVWQSGTRFGLASGAILSGLSLTVFLMGGLACHASLNIRPFRIPPAEPLPGHPDHLIIISIDGLKREYLLQQDQLGLEIPTLAALMATGSYAASVESVYPSVTYPAHTTIVTGVTPAKHGVDQNLMFDPKDPIAEKYYWDSRSIRAKTIWQAESENGGKTASVNWPVTVDARMNFNIPEYWDADGLERTLPWLRRHSTPKGLVTTIEDTYFSRIDWKRYKRRVSHGLPDPLTAQALKYLVAREKPDLVLGHFVGLDDAQHRYGPFSPEAYGELEKIDRWIGEILRATRSAGTYEQTAFAIVSDHGFTPCQKRIRLNPVLRDHGLIKLDASGEITDWKAAIHGEGAMVGIVLKDPKDETTLATVRQLLNNLMQNPENGIARIYEKNEMARRGGFPKADLVVEALPGYSFSPAMKTPLVKEAFLAKGNHGYSPELPDMKTIFVVAGRGVKRGVVVPNMNLLDIAPTLGLLRHWSLPEVQGQGLRIFFQGIN